MKTKEETRNKRVHLEELCPFAGTCVESDYRGREICKTDYKTCENYSLFKKGNIIIEKLPPGICWGAIETLVDKAFLSWKLLGIGRVHKEKVNLKNPNIP